MHRYEAIVLKMLSGRPSAGFDELASASKLGKDEVMWALENLKAKGMVVVEYSEQERIVISEEGKEYVKDGLPEEQLLNKLREKEVNVADLVSQKGRIGLQWARKDNFVQISNGLLKLTDAGRIAAGFGTKDGNLLREIANGEYDERSGERSKEAMLNLVKRKLISIDTQKHIQSISITKEGMEAPKEVSQGVIDNVDRNVIAGEEWKEKEFKRYDVNVGIERKHPAIRHPMKSMIEDVRNAYISMGFQEISGPAVETSFWAFDSLFVPQDHPARDMQDTFYVSYPESSRVDDESFVRRVKNVHESGWHSKWSEDISKQLILRPHTTSVSSRYVYNIIKEMEQKEGNYNLPIRLFSVGRVFRNEAIDYKHLADLYQMDGIIIGKDLTMSNLFDTLKKVYEYLGIEVKFRPSYFPFVEPGAEFSAKMASRNTWIEMGGCGMLREEIAGVKRSKLTVLAWGAGIERLMLIKDPKLTSITELYNNGIGWLRNREVI